MNLKRILALILTLFTIPTTGFAQEKTWKASIARAVITPEQPVWLSGYAGKRLPSGKVHDLWIKALALEDAEGRRAVVLTSDLIGFSKAAYDDLCAELKKRHGLGRDQVMLTFSHTHSGPVLRESLIDYFPLDDEARKHIADYSRDLEAKIVETIGRALADLQPALVEIGQGKATFAVNRRANREADVPRLLEQGEKLKGPVDHSVPLLVVRGRDSKLRGLVFGYACHNTTLNGTQWCGDYAGFAQAALEKEFPGAAAMFWTGCGADQNPLPRRRVELCEGYGTMLAEAVKEALARPLQPLPPALRTAFAFVDLKYEKNVSRATLEKAAKEDSLRGRWARRLLQRIDAREKLATATSYEYPIQVWQLGTRPPWIVLGGEVVVDFSLRFKAEFDPGAWVTAYANDLVAYIPSRRVWDEGGYEGAGVYEYGLPAERWAADAEEQIAATVHDLVRRVRAPEKRGAAPAAETVPTYAEHQDLRYYLDDRGSKHPVKTAADWEIRKRHILVNLQKVMGPLPGAAKAVPLDVQQVEEVRLDGIIRRKIHYQSEPGDRVTAYLFIPPGAGHKLPAVLCLHQTSNLGKAEPAGLGDRPNMQYALHLAQRGYVTLAPDYPSFGEHAWDFDPKRGYASGTMKAIWDNRRAVDLLQALPEVDAARIGCIGHSLGGHNAMFTAVFDERIQVIVSSCGFTRFHKDDLPSWTGQRYMPRIATVYGNDPDRVPFDFPEIVAAFAPRPFLACAAIEDRDFDVSGVRDVMAAARPIYELFGKKDALQAYYPQSKHDFPADARKVAYEFLDSYLK
jgi:neutral ceramidase